MSREWANAAKGQTKRTTVGLRTRQEMEKMESNDSLEIADRRET